MDRRFALLGLASLVLAAPASAQSAPQAAPQTPPQAAADLRPRLPIPVSNSLVTLEGAERAAALARANETLNAVARLQGRFVQTAPDGARAGGAFYLQRPGKLRFEYDPPATILIVSDGNVVALRDTALRTTDRTPLNSTPLNLILRNRIDLERQARIVRVSRQGEWMLVTARDRTGQTDGAITLQFFGPDAELRSWDVVDLTGARTRITLSEVTQPASLDRALFRLEDMLDSRRRGPR